MYCNIVNSIICLFFSAVEIIPPASDILNPCYPSPCGPNSQCEVLPTGDFRCKCLPDFISSPPQCRPECISNSDCTPRLSCIQQKCRDPCPGSCGINAECHVVSHTPNCVCLQGFTGDPFIICNKQCKQSKGNIFWFLILFIAIIIGINLPCNMSFFVKMFSIQCKTFYTTV